MMEKVIVELCMGSSCFSRGNSRALELIENFIEENDYSKQIKVKGHLCLGNCSRGPIMKINNKDYENINPDCVIDLIRQELNK